MNEPMVHTRHDGRNDNELVRLKKIGFKKNAKKPSYHDKLLDSV